MLIIFLVLAGIVGYTYYEYKDNFKLDTLKSEINAYLYNFEYEKAFLMLNEDNSKYNA